MTDIDTVLLLIIAILGCAFAAIELAGERLKGFHTISWLASMHPALKWFIVICFAVSGIVLSIWFHGHACQGCIIR